MFMAMGYGPLLLGRRSSPNWLGSEPYARRTSACGGGILRMSSDIFGSAVEQAILPAWARGTLEQIGPPSLPRVGGISTTAEMDSCSELPSSEIKHPLAG